MRESLQRRVERLERHLKPDPDEGRYCRCRRTLAILHKTKDNIVFDGDDEEFPNEEATLYRKGEKGPTETRVEPGDDVWCIQCRLPIRDCIMLCFVSTSTHAKE